MRPEKFYGFSRKNVEARVEVPDTEDDSHVGDETSEDVERNRIVM